VTGAPLDFGSLWSHALTFEQFLLQSKEEHRALWEGIYRHLPVPATAASLNGRPLKLLVITEDWCMDASSTIPALARLAEQAPSVELRILLRDQHPEVMSRYLTNGARSIPIVIGLDSEFRELGHWGPRPGALQAWVMANKDVMPKDERLREQRRWYARDRGETTVREVMQAMTSEG
jgi:hypothetical protein